MARCLKTDRRPVDRAPSLVRQQGGGVKCAVITWLTQMKRNVLDALNAILFANYSLRGLYTLLLCGILAGCATLPAPPSEQTKQDWGELVIVPARFPPQSNIRSFAVGKGAGAAKGAAIGSTAGVAAAGVFAVAGGPLAVVLAPYLAVATATGVGAAGAYAGSQVAISEQNVAEIEAVIQDNLMLLQIPGTLAQGVVDTAERDAGLRLPLLAGAGPAAPEQNPDYQALAQQGAESVLAIVVDEIGFTKDEQLSFYLVANVRVTRVSNGDRLYERAFVYQSDEYDSYRWGKDHAALFRAEFQRAYANLAESVVEQVFLLTALPLESRARASGYAGLKDIMGGRDACGLAWVSPEHDYRPSISDTTHATWNRFPVMGSRQPELAWEAFPRDNDRRADTGGDLSGISNIRYDLRVWQVVADAPPGLIYERRDLSEPWHALEQSLSPGSRYFWSARARFDSGGSTHSTKWGYFRAPNYVTRGKVKPPPSPAVIIQAGMAGIAVRDVCTLDFIPTINYYRFQTP